MLTNRSVPTNTVLPHVVYHNLEAAIAWLTSVFGFQEHYRYGNPVAGVQMQLGDASIQIYRARPGYSSPAQLGAATQSLTVFVEEVEAHFDRSKSAGAKIVEELHETEYGELQYGAVDLEGHHWLFSRHARDVAPEEWGAIAAKR